MDEIINALCLHTADCVGVRPTDVQVELSWEEDTGYTAELWVNGRIDTWLNPTFSSPSCSMYSSNIILEHFVSISR